ASAGRPGLRGGGLWVGHPAGAPPPPLEAGEPGEDERERRGRGRSHDEGSEQRRPPVAGSGTGTGQPEPGEGRRPEAGELPEPVARPVDRVVHGGRDSSACDAVREDTSASDRQSHADHEADEEERADDARLRGDAQRETVRIERLLSTPALADVVDREVVGADSPYRVVAGLGRGDPRKKSQRLLRSPSVKREPGPWSG